MISLAQLARAQRESGVVFVPRAIRAVQDQVAQFASSSAIQLVLLDPSDLTRLEIKVTPEDGLWKGETYRFGVQIPHTYPDDAPRVRCDDPILHPSISTTGGVCVNVIRESYSSSMTLEGIAHALMFLLLEPSPKNPLNKEAADMMGDGVFVDAVKRSLVGETINGIKYPKRK